MCSVWQQLKCMFRPWLLLLLPCCSLPPLQPAQSDELQAQVYFSLAVSVKYCASYKGHFTTPTRPTFAPALIVQECLAGRHAELAMALQAHTTHKSADWCTGVRSMYRKPEISAMCNLPQTLACNSPQSCVQLIDVIPVIIINTHHHRCHCRSSSIADQAARGSPWCCSTASGTHCTTCSRSCAHTFPHQFLCKC